MATFNVKEESGKMYVYCSKNAVSDVAASNFFGKATAWVSGGTYSSGDRVTSSSVQYRNFTGNNTTTAPASDTTNWVFDFDNYQPYVTAKTYAIGNKTVYSNEHYVCTAVTTGPFDVTKWNKVIISNRDVPYKLMNTAINLINSDARFISYELLDIVNNVAYHNINCIIGNGSWNETLTNPTKYVRIVGQSNLKTEFKPAINSVSVNYFFDNLKFNANPIENNNTTQYIKFNNVYVYRYANTIGAGVPLNILFCYKSVFNEFSPCISGMVISHLVSCTFINYNPIYYTLYPIYTELSVFKNNYIKAVTINLGTLAELQKIPLGNMDYNFYDGTIQVGGVTQTSIAMLQATLPNQNIYSIKGTTTLNSDYTLPVGSPLIKAGSNGNNIGAEGVGYPQTNSTIFDSANGAIYKNVTKYGTTLTRQQISKTAQGGGNNTITLEAAASAIDNEYNTFRIYISSGTGSGQTKTITGYVGATKVATVDSNWTVNPDASSVYEILDGEITSSVGDLGSIQTVKKLLVQATNFYDATGCIINQSVSETDARLDNPAALTFDLRVSNTSDLSAIAYRRFVQDDYLKVDSNDKGCGDSAYNCANLVSSVLSFRYFQIKLMLRK